MNKVSLSLNRKGFKHPNLMRPFIGKDGGAYVFNQDFSQKIPVNNATLTYDEWRDIDDMLVDVGRQRQDGIQDLRDFGLIKSLANPMASTVLTYSRISDSMTAEISISPKRRTAGDRTLYENVHLPLPIIHSDFDIEERVLQESQVRGNGLDVENVFSAGYAVSLKIVDMLFGSSSLFAYGGGTIYTYLTEPNRNTGTLINAWNSSANATGASILSDVLAMKQALINDNYQSGPFVLYIPTAYETVLDEDYDATTATGRTIRERILQISGVERIVVVDRLAAGNVLLVAMNRNVVDLVDGFPLTTVTWDDDPFNHKYKVMAMQIPRVKSDYSDQSGIAHWSE